MPVPRCGCEPKQAFKNSILMKKVLSIKWDSTFCIIASETRTKPIQEAEIMNKIMNWIRDHKEESADLGCIVAFAAVAVMFFFGRETAAAICAVGALIGIGANVTA